MNITEIGWGGMMWIDPSQDRDIDRLVYGSKSSGSIKYSGILE